MEMMGVVFTTHELQAGSLGSCVAEECRSRGMGESFFFFLLLTCSVYPQTDPMHAFRRFTVTKG